MRVVFLSPSILSTKQLSRIYPPSSLPPTAQLSPPQNITLGNVLQGNRVATLLPITNTGGPGRFLLFPAATWPPPPTTPPRPPPPTLMAGHFTLSPTAFSLGRGETVQLHASFRPPAEGSYSEEVVVVCDNCNVQHVGLHGEGTLVRVTLLGEGLIVAKGREREWGLELSHVRTGGWSDLVFLSVSRSLLIGGFIFVEACGFASGLCN